MTAPAIDTTSPSPGDDVAALLRGKDRVCVVDVPPALTLEFAAHMTETLARAATDERVHVVALVGRQAETFSSGLDLAGVREGAVDPDEALRAVGRCLRALHECPRTTLAVVRGSAIGGGLGMAAACDYVLASESSRYALPELLWGFVPAAIWPLVVQRLGAPRARAWMVTAVSRSAQEAYDAGLVDELVPDDAMVQAVSRTVRNLLRTSPDAVALLRRWSHEAQSLPVGEAIERGSRITAEWLGREDVRERLERFFSGEAPWKA